MWLLRSITSSNASEQLALMPSVPNFLAIWVHQDKRLLSTLLVGPMVAPSSIPQANKPAGALEAKAIGEYADTEIGRLIEAIETTGQLDNTLIFYIVGDNGASAEGGMDGLFNEYSYFNGAKETVQEILKHYDELGGPTTYPHYAAGWASRETLLSLGRSRLRLATATRNGMVIHWPNGITAKGELRSQWHHVIDIAPTILEAAGLPEPTSVNGTVQTPIEGVSLLYTFGDPKAPSRHTTQYFEIFACHLQ
jgi:arylsulfatase A-like enzyme